MASLAIFASVVIGQAAQAAPPKQAAPIVKVAHARTLVGVRPLAFAAGPNGSQVAMTLEDKSVRIVDAKTYQTVKTFQGHPQPAYAIAWSPDGAYLATGDESARIFVWDVRTGQRVRTFYGDHTRGIQDLSFNLPRTLLMSTGKDDAINVYDMSTGKRVGKVLGQGANLYAGVFNPKTNSFLTGTLATSARLYRLGSDGAHPMNFLNGHDGQGMLDINWSPDGTRAITAGRDSFAILWDMKSFKRQGTLKGHQDQIWHARFAPNGKIAVTASNDRTVRIWDTKTFQQVAQLDDMSSVGSPIAITSDGKYMAAVGIDDYLKIYSLTPPQALAPAKPAPKKKK